ncbi:MAG: terminase, partial [Alphaproteobacteria bacterium]|nr:terminase [Alphaproteobacteria bacterium]
MPSTSGRFIPTRWSPMSQKQPRSLVLTTRTIAGTFRYGAKRFRNRYAIPVAGPLDLPEANLPVHPYVLGAWLGDGNSQSTQITTHGDDLEIADIIRSTGVNVVVRQNDKSNRRVFNLHLDPYRRDPRHCRRGHDMDRLGRSKKGYCAECARQSSKASQYGFRVDPVVNPPDSLARRLRGLGVLRGGSRTDRTNVKHIPALYQRASIGQRLALLQGLMDTDGYIDGRGRCEFTSVLPRLAEGFGELLSSLGIKHSVRLKRTSTTYLGRKIECQPAWRFSFLVYDDKPVFRLRRKLTRQPGRVGRRTTETERRRIVDVQAIPSVPARCIQVDSPSRLFLAGRTMIPTHNTEILANTVGYHIEQDPAPIMVVMPTERDAETWSKDRFAPMARDTSCLTGLIADPRSRDGNNKILHKKFPGGHLTLVGANAPSGLASRPIRILLCDEIDRYPFSAGAEGDPVNLARKRTVTFWNRKIVLVSTPTLRGASRIETAFAESDQRRFWVPCPDCGRHQVLAWDRVHWDKAPSGVHRPETARYQCIHCDASWSDARRWAAIRQGEWRTERPFNGVAGFHLNEIYSSWVRFETMVRSFLSAKDQGDEAMKTFVNTSLGETWIETGEAPDWQRLYERREDWQIGTVPSGGLFLTAGADVQKDRIEVSVWAWGRGLTSWFVDHIVIDGV